MLSVLSSIPIFPQTIPSFLSSPHIYPPSLFLPTQFPHQNYHTPKMTSLEGQSTTAALERRAAARLGAPLPPPTTTAPLPCPRCQSPDTKFCYYNNYNFSQPRYFCKSCRRYWTRGGALRDVPVGGGSRKSAKRSRTASPASSATSTVPLVPVDSMPIYSGEIGGESCGKFTTLLALGGYGLGLGLGLDLEEDRCGRYVGSSAQWIMRDSGYPVNVNGSYVGGIADDGLCGDGGCLSNGSATWHMEGVGGGEYYSSMPELAISTPTNDDVK